MLTPGSEEHRQLLAAHKELTFVLQDQENSLRFNPGTFIRRALVHDQFGYPDLAVGDAYRALLLTDEAFDESSIYQADVVSELLRSLPEFEQWQNLQLKIRTTSEDGDSRSEDGEWEIVEDHDDIGSPEIDVERLRRIAQERAKKHHLHAYHILTLGLEEVGCLRTAYDFCLRGLKAFPDDPLLSDKLIEIPDNFCKKQLSKDANFKVQDFDSVLDLPKQGYVRREIYPWNDHEPDRCNEQELQLLNAQLKDLAPSCEVRAVELPTLQSSDNASGDGSRMNTQLGLVAKQDLPAGSTILREPSIMTARIRADAALCDACTTPLPNVLASTDENEADGPVTCPDCPEDDILFCTRACRDAALKIYHRAICGVPEYDLVAKDPSDPADAPNNLYFLLLARIFAMSATQDTNPLDLPSTRSLWGDFRSSPHHPYDITSSCTLPFSFHHNILWPIHLLTQLNLPPWAIDRFDTWVVNTLYAKLRGVASARMGRDGKPEAGAVHGLWCLANHSCSPNIMWEFGNDKGGREMRMIVRRREEKARWGSSGEEGKGEAGEGSKDGIVHEDEGWDGIQAGEQILNHYCDISLPVRERREWAKGALGGMCVCERCVWEAGEEEACVEKAREGLQTLL